MLSYDILKFRECAIPHTICSEYNACKYRLSPSPIRSGQRVCCFMGLQAQARYKNPYSFEWHAGLASLIRKDAMAGHRPWRFLPVSDDGRKGIGCKRCISGPKDVKSEISSSLVEFSQAAQFAHQFDSVRVWLLMTFLVAWLQTLMVKAIAAECNSPLLTVSYVCMIVLHPLINFEYAGCENL